MVAITAVILTRNEEAHIARCLESVRWADEIVVVDDGSTDRTVEICHERGARVFHRSLDTFDRQRNFADDQAHNDWVFSLDADEEATPELAAEIQAALQQPPPVVAYRVPVLQTFCGAAIRHGGWYRPGPIRCYRRTHGRWEGEVHERLVPRGPVGQCQHSLRHYSHPTLADFLTKLNRYTSLEAAAYVRAGKRTNVWKIMLSPLRDFLNRFFLLRGYRDGMRGLALALLMAMYVCIVRLKVWELTQAETPVE